MQYNLKKIEKALVTLPPRENMWPLRMMNWCPSCDCTATVPLFCIKFRPNFQLSRHSEKDMISQRGPQHNNGFPCLLEKGLKFEDFRSWDMIISYLGSHCLPPRQELYVDLDQGPAPAVPGKEAAHGPSAESGGASDPDGERDGSKVPKDSDLGHYAQEAIKRVPIPKPESAPHVPEKSTLPGVEGREFAEWCVDAEEEEDLFGLKRKLQEARAAVAAARVAAGQAPTTSKPNGSPHESLHGDVRPMEPVPKENDAKIHEFHVQREQKITEMMARIRELKTSLQFFGLFHLF